MPFHHSFLPIQGPQPSQKLEEYANLYTTYADIVQQQADAMRHDPQQMQQAYDLVAAEFAAEQLFAPNIPGKSCVLKDLNEYARRCMLASSGSFEDRVRIAFAASNFIQILMNFIIGELNKNDMEWVLARSTQIRSRQPIPIFAPAVCQLKPDGAATVSVTNQDIAHWRSRPRKLVGKCFVTRENIMRRTFLIQDYYVRRTGPRYEVIYEDTGPGVLNLLDPKTVFTMVEDAELFVF